MQTIKLNNGVEMPQMGYGVFQVAPKNVKDAFWTRFR